MENEETQIENNDSTNVEEEVVEKETTDNAPEITLEDYERVEKEKKALYERAKKAEAQVKEFKTLKPKEAINNNVPSGLSDEQRQEVALIARGVPQSVINEAFTIAKAKGLTLNQAMEEPILKAYYSQVKAEEKKEKAQLGASGKPGSYKEVDLRNAVGMTEEEHRKAIGM